MSTRSVVGGKLSLFLSRGLAVITATVIGGAVAAEPYPSRPIKLVVPYGTGTGLDALARRLADRASQHLGQRIVVENRPGAGTTIGATYVARSTPDGYTILLAGIGTVTAASLVPEVTFDMVNDFAPIIRWYSEPLFLLVPPATGAKTFDQLVSRVKGKKEAFSFASSNVGTSAHLAGELFRVATGGTLTHVPYNGPAMLPDLIAGRISMMFYSYDPTKSFIEAGKLLPLATTGYERLSVLPSVPTMTELDFPDVTMTTWAGLYGARGTPSEAVERIRAAFDAVISDKAVQESLNRSGQQPWVVGPKEFAEFTKSEMLRFQKLTKAIGISVK